MFSIALEGHFELNEPEEFLQDLQELIKKHKAEYFGRTNVINLGEYVDFQKIEDEPETENEITNESKE